MSVSYLFSTYHAPPDDFVDRTREVGKLLGFIESGCRVCTVYGLGGVGKSALAHQIAHVGTKSHRRTIWVSLTNAPPVAELLHGILSLFPDRDAQAAGTPTEQLGACLTDEACFIVFDNLEVLLDSERFSSEFRPEYEEYGTLLRYLASEPHRSTILITSRENPSFLRETNTTVRSLHLQGLPKAPARTLLARRGLRGDVRLRGDLVSKYDGNPLAIQLASDLILDIHDGNIARFVESGEYVFGELRGLFHQHFERLTRVERLVLFQLAAARRPLTAREISAEARFGEESTATLLQRLRRRSLIQESDGSFGLQYMIQEFVTARLNADCVDEIHSRRPDVLPHFALVDAGAPEHVREAQRRFLTQPMMDMLRDRLGSDSQVTPHILSLLDASRVGRPFYGTYLAANALSVHQACTSDLSGLDLSELVLHRLDLSGFRLSDASARFTEFSGCRFPGVYHYVFALDFSPEGKVAAIGQSGGSVVLVNVPDGTMLNTLHWEADWVRTLAFSPDGRRLACTDERGRLRVWDLTTHLPTDFAGHDRQIRSVVFSADGKTLFSAGEDRRVLAWPMDSDEREPRLLCALDAEVWQLHSAPTSPLIAAACDSTCLRIWDTATGEEVALAGAGTVAGRSLRFSLDGRHVFVGCDDGTIRVWSLESRALVAELPGHTSSVWALATTRSASGEVLITGSHDETIRVWSAAEPGTARCERVITSLDGPVWPVAADGEGHYFATVGRNSTIRFWDTADAECVEVLSGSSGTVLAVAASPDGRLLATGGHDRLVRVWDAESGTCLTELQGHTAGVRAVAFHPAGTLLATAGEDWDVRLWDLRTRRLTAVLTGSRNWLWTVAFEPNGHSVAAAGADAVIRIWDIQGRGGAHALTGHEARVRAIQYTADGQRMVSVGEDGQTRLWQVADGTSDLLDTVDRHVTSLCLLDDNRCVTGDSSGQLRLWDLDSGTSIGQARGHEGPILSLLAAPGENTFLSAGRDGRLRTWAADGPRLLGVTPTSNGTIRSTAWSADGTRAAAVGVDEAIRRYAFPELNETDALRVARQFEGLDITGCRGITAAELTTLLALGAVETPSTSRPAVPPPRPTRALTPPGARPTDLPSSARPAKMFISYSHRDDELRSQLEKHLSLLRWRGLLDSWSDRQIRPGDEWNGAIDDGLESADIILLLVSADFLASDYCRDIEMLRAMERHGEGTARVVPVVLRACDWRAFPFGTLQALPQDGRPVTAWPNPDAAFTDIAVWLRITLEDIAQSARADGPTTEWGPS
ncbi:TIR domain-containing protein [Streptomyces johnsoniae]|uniref:TIR domain-containing protein n=1 Tax=Streptomyces johnsoniae TaxID=3075532 RepID=A0ABU2RZ68_9ACTN|nr:TIR domain-containing protein [Streptomyces sp. DSM 41886]MDT0442058.1 TIR domain-containing protein [Streptomyces sp. DSM 41886]